MDYLLAALYGVVEGITEWLPISSTGHMILLEEFLKMNVSQAFWDLFLVVVQLGAILAVVVLYWRRLWPFFRRRGRIYISTTRFLLWCKIIVCYLITRSMPCFIIMCPWRWPSSCLGCCLF